LKFYFNCNNKTQAKALKEAGAKNVMVSYKYDKNLDYYKDNFERIGVIPGNIDNLHKYYEWAYKNLEDTEFITQYDVPMDMEKTIKYYELALRDGIEVSPVLTVNYMQHLGRLNLHDDRTIVLGKMGGNIEEDGQVPKLPENNYHGLSKGRWLSKTGLTIKSFNSSTWLSGVRGRKTDVWGGESVTLGRKAQGNMPPLLRAIEKNQENLEKVGVKGEDILSGDYTALLKAPLALYYRPMFAVLGSLSENFSS